MTARGISLPLIAAILSFCTSALSRDATDPVPFAALDGWSEDDQAAALGTFRRGCPYRELSLMAVCAEALSLGDVDAPRARGFFEQWFDPAEVTGPDAPGLLTGYYEPVFAGSPTRTDAFSAPLLSLHPDIVSPDPDKRLPERAAIENGALAERADPIVWLDPADAFAVHVQGSARIGLPDGSSIRVGYAGRNGWPYTSIARLLADRLGALPSEMDANRLTAWLKANPDEGRSLMRENRSYIFFRASPDLADNDGPLGAAGIPLDAGRSLAVDNRVWRYGLPVWLEGSLPEPGGRSTRLRRLVVAQDTGAAIVGHARADLYLGSGAAAGLQAGLVRERVRMVVFLPKVSRDGGVP